MEEEDVKRVKYFFRSEPMLKCELLLSTDTAFDCILELGSLSKVQLIPHELHFDDSEIKPYLVDVKRCAELLKVIDFIEAQMNEVNVPFTYYPDIEEDFPPAVDDLGKYENQVYATDAELRQILYHIDQLRRGKEYNEEKAKALKIAEEFLSDEGGTQQYFAWSDSTIVQILHNEEGRPNYPILGLLLGTIATEKYASFERVLFRTFRGNYYIRSSRILIEKQVMMQPKYEERRTVFLLCFLGESVGKRIIKLCNGYSVQFHDCDVSSSQRRLQAIVAETKARDIDIVIEKTNEYRQSILNILAGDLYIWKFNTRKIMTCYIELNKMKLDSKYLTCMCWIPISAERDVRDALQRASLRGSRNNNLVYVLPPILTPLPQGMKEVPPTYFQLNNFTHGFQALIDAYGIANYREVNPAPYTIVTFPFLFAVMFGDIGHGAIMLIFAIVLQVKHKKYRKSLRLQKSPNEIANILFAGRFIIFLMGLFSIYTGLIYNDLFSKSLNMAGSAWYVDKDAWNRTSYDLNPESPANYRGHPYVFGMDPVWKISGDTSIITFNSVKMKLAIIIGVMHMLFGLALSASNQLYFEHYIDLILITVPQIIIFSSLFLYLVVLIFYKWIHYGGLNEPPYNTACAPSILITFIDMCLMKESHTAYDGCKDFMYSGQTTAQYVLLGMALISIPILLAGKPIYFHIQKWKISRIDNTKLKEELSRSTIVSANKSLYYKIDFKKRHGTRKKSNPVEDIEDYDTLELWIHSGIHAIDSVLGAVSHTASYLRLWALSLAHEQLSHVLWMMVLKRGFGHEYYYSVLLFLVFGFWAVLTVAILVTMEALSAFLHTLRLHWVEFQSKFYTGAGTAFTPFYFEPPNKYLT